MQTLQAGLKNWSSRFKSHSEQGFTLIEIMLVLTLIAILSAVTMPSLRGFTASSRLKSSAHAIRDMLHFARDMAITEKAAHLVVFDFDRNLYWLASSETFDVTDPSTSSVTSPSSTVLQAASQARTQQATAAAGEPTTISRTSMILGIPQEIAHNINLSRMMTNRNSQSSQVESGVDYIYFSPTSTSEDTIMYIQDHRGKTMSITIESATGRVYLQQIADEDRDELGLPTISDMG